MLRLMVFEQDRRQVDSGFSGKIWLGREATSVERTQLGLAFGTTDPTGDTCFKIAYATHTDLSVSRWAIEVKPLSDQTVRISVAGKNCYEVGNKILGSGESLDCSLPFKIRDRGWSFHFSADYSSDMADSDSVVNLLGIRPIAPYSHGEEKPTDTDRNDIREQLVRAGLIQANEVSSSMRKLSSGGMDVKDVLFLLEETLGIIQSAVSDREFFEKATQVMVNLLDLDQAWAMTMTSDGNWEVVAKSSNANSLQPILDTPNQLLLEKLSESRQSVWMRTGDRSLTRSELQLGLSESVGAPVLGPDGKVVGGLCGVKYVDLIMNDPSLPHLARPNMQTASEVRTIIMQILAGCVATGVAHLAIKQERDQLEILMDQYFTTTVSNRIRSDPGLLRGSECEITSLFCDIRNFSRISSNLRPETLLEWLRECLSGVSECVPRHDGVLVDYIGDELMAIWGSICCESDHAVNAVKAGFAMTHIIRSLSEQWKERLGMEFQVGIGINTGNAFLGNIGTSRKMKFGAIGNSVNLASRVQGATKYFKCPFLVTQSTWKQLGNQFLGRRIGQIGLLNIPSPVELYQVFESDSDQLSQLCLDYETALLHLERSEFQEAARISGKILGRFRDDRPSLILMQRAVNAMIDPSAFSVTHYLTEK